MYLLKIAIGLALLAVPFVLFGALLLRSKRRGWRNWGGKGSPRSRYADRRWWWPR